MKRPYLRKKGSKIIKIFHLAFHFVKLLLPFPAKYVTTRLLRYKLINFVIPKQFFQSVGAKLSKKNNIID